MLIILNWLTTHCQVQLYIEGPIDPCQLKAIGRLGSGGGLYCRIGDTFELKMLGEV